jgi:hypothetical protein
MRKRLSIDLPPETHTQLKAWASAKGLTLQRYILSLVEADLFRQGRIGGVTAETRDATMKELVKIIDRLTK